MYLCVSFSMTSDMFQFFIFDFSPIYFDNNAQCGNKFGRIQHTNDVA